MKISKANKRGNHVFTVKLAKLDLLEAKEQRNLARVHNPHLKPGQRACHHGYRTPGKMWKSCLEQAMDEYNRKQQQSCPPASE